MFFVIKRLIIQVGLVLSFSLLSQLASATQTNMLLESLRLSSQKAETIGLKRQVFDYKSSKLNFETFVPNGAELTLTSYKDQPVEDGQIGRVIPLGKVKMSYDDVAIENNMYLYKLRYVPAALRVCQWQMNKFGYFIVHSSAKDKFAEAQLFGVKSEADGKRPTQVQFGYCYARGDVLVAHFFSSSFSYEKDDKILDKDEKEKKMKLQEEKTIVALHKVVSYFAANMIMADGKKNVIDKTMMKNVAVDLDDHTLMLTYPDGIDLVVNNSQRKILPYEFHFVQKFDNDEIFSHLFLLINKTSEPASEDSFRRQADIFAKINLSSQLTSGINKKAEVASGKNTVSNKKTAPEPPSQLISKDAAKNIEYEFISRNSITGFTDAGIMARAYQYKIIDKNNPGHYTFFLVSVIGYKDKTYILSYHSLRDSVSQLSEYFSGIGGDVAYDSLRDSIYDFLITLK